jgi:hypothetical protein
MRLIQLQHPERGRQVAAVDEPRLLLLSQYRSVFEMAQVAISAGKRLAEIVGEHVSSDSLDYDEVYAGQSPWKILPAFDHPSEPARCLVTGTGLTHRASAENRQSMHGDPAQLTDSMKMYRIGVEGGRPKAGSVGTAPEWFYKGTGDILRGHGEPLAVPAHGDDGGDEAEIAGVYVIGPDGLPWRIGLAQANEFSDHVLEAKNYLYLSQSKLRPCSIGPELAVDADFSDVPGRASIVRGDKIIWSGALASGEKSMCHSLANLEHHHFKHAAHRKAGDAHIHFFGADMFSFKDRLRLEEGDVMEIAFENFGRPLRNPIVIDRSPQTLVTVRSL